MTKQEDSSLNLKRKTDSKKSATCSVCSKIFAAPASLSYHMKSKHPQIEEDKSSQYAAPHKTHKRQQAKTISRSALRAEQSRQNDIEDLIYAFFGELGERFPEKKNQTTTEPKPSKHSNHQNYSSNHVVRTPYEPCLDPKEVLNDDASFDDTEHKDFLVELRKELLQLHKKIDAEKDIWDIRDPVQPEENTKEEFTLMEVRKLIINYPKKELNLQYPFFSIFVLWLGRICKPTAFKDLFSLLGTFLAMYYSKPDNHKDEPGFQRWRSFHCEQVSNLAGSIAVRETSVFARNAHIQLCQNFITWMKAFVPSRSNE